MARGKIEVKRIENNTSRQVTFSKRRAGLMKKTHELSVLCDAQIGLIVFSNKGKLYEYCSNNYSMGQIVERYLKTTRTCMPQERNDYRERILNEITRIKNETLKLQLSLQRYKGEDLKSVQFDELSELENQLQRSVDKVRARKFQLLQQQVENLKKTENQLFKENEEIYQWLMSNQIERQQMDIEHQQLAMTELKLQGQHCSSSSIFDHHQFPFSGEINEQQQDMYDNNKLHLDQPHYYASSSSSFRLQPTQPNLQEPSHPSWEH